MTTNHPYGDLTNTWIATQLSRVAQFSTAPVTDHAPQSIDDIINFAEFCTWLINRRNQPDLAWDLRFLDEFDLFTRLAAMLRHMQTTLPPAEQATEAWDSVEGDIEIALEWVDQTHPTKHVTDRDAFLALVAQIGERATRVEQTAAHVRHIDVVQWTEGLGSAEYFILPKAHAQSTADAFIALCLHLRHTDPWWGDMHPTASRDAFIANLWLYPAHVGYQAQPLTSDQILDEQTRVDAMIALLIEQPDADIRKRYPHMYGLFVDGTRIPTPLSRAALGLHNALAGRAIRLVWNDIRIFYETADSYIYHTWGTAA